MPQFRAEAYGLARLYRFRKAVWEEQYAAQSRRWRWYACMVHFYCRVAFDTAQVICLQPGQPVYPDFYTHIAIIALSLVCLLVGHLSPMGRRWIVELHFAFCVLLIGLHAYLCPQRVATYSAASHAHLVPSALYRVVLEGPDGDRDVDSQLLALLQQLCASWAVDVSMFKILLVQMHMAITGLTPYTAPTLGLSILGMACSYSFTPGALTGDLAWAIAMLSLNALFFVGFGAVVECWGRTQFLTEAFLARELHASQTADSILNHTLKNVLADAAATIELFLAGTVERHTLEAAIDCLRRGMRACRERQVYLKLVAGEYTPALHAVDLEEFGRELVAGRGVASRLEKLTVHTDAVLLNLILENAISNALKHGHPSNPQVQFTISSRAVGDDPSCDRRRLLHFTVTNLAHPQRPVLTPEFVAQLLAGKVEVANHDVVPVLSDRIGISHCVLAAQTGGIAVQLAQEGDTVTFCASVEVEVVTDKTEVPETPTLSLTPVPFPAGLRFTVLDDSVTSQRLLQFHIAKSCAPSAMRCFGEVEEDMEAFVTATLAEADIAILDQNLQYATPRLGTDVAQRLVRSGFTGFICLRSANDSAEDRELYMRSGAHCCFGKDLLGRQLMDELKAAYCLFRARATTGSEISSLPQGNGGLESQPPHCSKAHGIGPGSSAVSAQPCPLWRDGAAPSDSVRLAMPGPSSSGDGASAPPEANGVEEPQPSDVLLPEESRGE
eukprot:EG_transcript_2995